MGHGVKEGVTLLKLCCNETENGECQHAAVLLFCWCSPETPPSKQGRQALTFAYLKSKQA